MNTVKLTHSNGGTDYHVRIPKFKLSDVIDGASDTVHPAFVVGGKVIEEIYVSKYPNSVYNGVPYSLPYQKATTEINFDKAVALCESKGKGWHLFTNAEWAAIALWCLKNGKQPHGNTSNGKYHADHNEKGLTYDGYDTLTGSGPEAWAHDGTEDGIYNLVGDVWEWIAGLRVSNGAVQIIPNNNAAFGIDMSQQSKEWQGTGYGFNLKGGTIAIEPDTDITKTYGGGWFKDIDKEKAPEIFKALALAPTTGDEQGYCWVDNEEAERLPVRGGGWCYVASAGVFALNLLYPRSFVAPGVGFRSAFIGNLESATL
jgi:hypothetical protein